MEWESKVYIVIYGPLYQPPKDVVGVCVYKPKRGFWRQVARSAPSTCVYFRDDFSTGHHKTVQTTRSLASFVAPEPFLLGGAWLQNRFLMVFWGVSLLFLPPERPSSMFLEKAPSPRGIACDLQDPDSPPELEINHLRF